MIRRGAWSVCLWLVCAGCALTPDYERPELDLPETYLQPAPPGESIANLTWWDLYGDPELRSLIETALEENQDLALALARVAEARYQVTFVRADQFPFLDVFGSGGRGRGSERQAGSQTHGGGPSLRTSDQFAIGGEISFEVDLWRKYSRATEGSRADLMATEAAHRNVTISLVASVASSYFLLRDLDARYAIAIRTAESRRDSLEIIRARFDKGTVPELDVNQAEIELAIAEASAVSFERQIIQAENALRILLGRYPGSIDRGLALDEQRLLPDVPAGLPSELLQRRPDVVAAEQSLAAETARIGVAEALRYPSISMTGSLGAIADELSDLNTNEAKAWNVAAGIFQPIFNSGRLKAQAESQRARAEQSLYAYEAVLRQAFREVEDALAAVRTLRLEYDIRARQVVSARNAARLSRARYDAGVVDFLEVLDTERTLFGSELDESTTQREALDAVVRLYKALGGGWTEPEPET
jgi:multidrug efflux system outer membrane protein